MKNIIFIGDCTQDEKIDELFDNVNNFACLVEEHGDNFKFGDIVVRYNERTDIHSFYRVF